VDAVIVTVDIDGGGGIFALPLNKVAAAVVVVKLVAFGDDATPPIASVLVDCFSAGAVAKTDKSASRTTSEGSTQAGNEKHTCCFGRYRVGRRRDVGVVRLVVVDGGGGGGDNDGGRDIVCDAARVRQRAADVITTRSAMLGERRATRERRCAVASGADGRG
jgi:hypothetical protein